MTKVKVFIKISFSSTWSKLCPYTTSLKMLTIKDPRHDQSPSHKLWIVVYPKSKTSYKGDRAGANPTACGLQRERSANQRWVLGSACCRHGWSAWSRQPSSSGVFFYHSIYQETGCDCEKHVCHVFVFFLPSFSSILIGFNVFRFSD